MPYFVSKGTRLYYKDLGKGKALLLVPGLGADSRAFNPLLPLIAPKMRILAPDPRGLGRSQGNPLEIAMETMVSDLIGLLDHSGIREVTLVGASFGCLVITELFFRHPEVAERMVFIAPPWSAGKRRTEALRGLRSILNKEEKGELIALKLLERILSPGYFSSNRERLGLIAASDPIDEKKRKIMARQLEILESHCEDCCSVGLPVLVVAGKLDSLVTAEEVEALGRLLPNCKMVFLEGVGHHIVMEAPNEVARVILEFCSGRPIKLPY